MIREYKFNYDIYSAEAMFIVDTEKFKESSARELLDFFDWEYDREGDPIDELMKKYAMKAIFVATSEYGNLYVVKRWFQESEGFISVDGSQGVELVSVSEYEFDEDSLEMTVKVNS